MIKSIKNSVMTEVKYAEHQEVYFANLLRLLESRKRDYIAYSMKHKPLAIGEDKATVLENVRKIYRGHVIIRKIEVGKSREENVLGRKVSGF